MAIEWTEDLATGIEAIDEQHRELYRQVAALHAAMKAGSLDRVHGLLDYLRRYSVEHFATEEEAMRTARYPAAALGAHRAAHRRFVDDFEAHAERATERLSPAVVVELSSWLSGWLRDHVRRVDGEMARFLRASGPPGSVPSTRR